MKIASINPYMGQISCMGTKTKKKNSKPIAVTYPKEYTAPVYSGNYYTFKSKNLSEPTFRTEFAKLVLKDSKNETPFVKTIKPGFVDKIENKIENHPEKGIVIGITGKSAAGKSTLTEKLIDSAKEKGIGVTLISADQYFRDTSRLIKKYGNYPNLIATGFEFDAPANFRLKLLRMHLNKLSEGETIKTPLYMTDGSGRCPMNVTEKKPAKLIIVEGLAAHYPYVEDAVDAKVFIDIDEKVREDRFVKRAPWRHPDWNHDQIMAQYYSTTYAADKYIAPLKDNADIIVNSGADMKDIESFIDGLTTSMADLQKASSK